MTIVITGANGGVASELMDYFSNKAAYVVGTVRQLSEKFEKTDNTTIIKWILLIIILLIRLSAG